MSRYGPRPGAAISRGARRPPGAWRRVPLGLGLLLLLAGCGAWPQGQEPPTPVVVVEARRGWLPEVAHLTGQVRAGRHAAVCASVAGRVLRVGVREGDRVRQGQPLVWMDTRQQEAQIAVQQAAVQQARARLGQMQAQYGMTETSRASEVQKAGETVTQADLDVQQAVARLQTAEVDMKRKEDLLASKAVARSDYETAVLNFKLSQDALASARSKAVQAREALRLAQVTARDQTVHASDLASAQADVEQAMATLAASRTTLEQMVLYAPLSGTVVNRDVETGQTISPGGEPLLELVDPAEAYVAAVVGQADVARLRLGMQAVVILAQHPKKPLVATIRKVIPAADPKTSTVRLALALEDAPPDLLDQAPASIWVRVGRREGLLVPRTALQGDRRNVHVVVVREGRAWRLPVRVILTDEVFALLSSGVAPRDAVVVEGGQFLSAGDPVTILRRDPARGPWRPTGYTPPAGPRTSPSPTRSASPAGPGR